MLSITDLKPGVIIEIDRVPHLVVRAQHAKLGRGGAILRSTLKNLRSGAQFEKTFKGEERFTEANIERTKAQMLFRDDLGITFMNLTDFEQRKIPKEKIGPAIHFLKEGEPVEILTHNNQLLQVNLPIKMNFKVIEADPNVRGDSATAPSKNATIETGYQLKVPLFIKVGDIVTVDTRDGTYVERAG